MWSVCTMKYNLAISRYEEFDTCYKMDRHWKHNAKWKKITRKSIHCLTPVYEMYKMGKFTELESILLFSGARGRVQWEMTASMFLFLFFVFCRKSGKIALIVAEFCEYTKNTVLHYDTIIRHRQISKWEERQFSHSFTCIIGEQEVGTNIKAYLYLCSYSFLKYLVPEFSFCVRISTLNTLFPLLSMKYWSLVTAILFYQSLEEGCYI